MKKLAGIGLALTLALTGCASGTQTATKTGSAAPNAEIKVMTCGEEITLKKAPEKVLMMDDIDASILLGLGVVDKVKFRAGHIKDGFSAADKAKLEAIPTLKGEKLETGGVKLSKEVVLEAQPDLIIGYPTGLDVPALKAAGIPLYSPPSFCAKSNIKTASFDLVNKEIETLGKLFNVSDKAKKLNEDVDKKIKALAAPADNKKTAVALYVEPGSPTFWAYGSSSMVQPIMEANGLKNLYGDNEKRVFDSNIEDVLQKNPDYVVLIYGDGTADEIKKTFLGFNGVDKMKAAKDNHVVVMSFALTDPPSLLSVEGATELSKLLKG